MANQRTTFLKRQREQNRLDKARAKQERLAARRASAPTTKGPPIAWAEAVRVDGSHDTEDISPGDVTEAPDDVTDE